MEKEKIDVYLQYPWGVSDSQYYRSMIKNPPKNIKYINQKRVGMISDRKIFFLSNFLKKQIRLWTKRLNIIIPNAHFSKDTKNCDIIHCAHCLSKNKDKPWVMDIESPWQMWISGIEKKNCKKKILEYLIRDNCKKIIAWTKETKKELVDVFPEIKNKIDVVYYAMPEQKIKSKKKGKEIFLFFSGRHFYAKGGLHATEVISRLTKKYANVRGIINGAIPGEIIEKYSKNKKLEFYQLMPYKDVLKLYQKSDIFIYPGYSDSFGFVFMDAMAFGVPIVTVDGHARREIIEENKTGFIIQRPNALNILEQDEELISNISTKVSKLIENETLRREMSHKCIRMIKEGKFSIKERNKKLERIYREVLK